MGVHAEYAEVHGTIPAHRYTAKYTTDTHTPDSRPSRRPPEVHAEVHGGYTAGDTPRGTRRTPLLKEGVRVLGAGEQKTEKEQTA